MKTRSVMFLTLMWFIFLGAAALGIHANLTLSMNDAMVSFLGILGFFCMCVFLDRTEDLADAKEYVLRFSPSRLLRRIRGGA